MGEGDSQQLEPSSSWFDYAAKTFGWSVLLLHQHPLGQDGEGQGCVLVFFCRAEMKIFKCCSNCEVHKAATVQTCSIAMLSLSMLPRLFLCVPRNEVPNT